MARTIKIGKTTINVDGFKGMKKAQFEELYKDKKLFNLEFAWSEIQKKLKEK